MLVEGLGSIEVFENSHQFLHFADFLKSNLESMQQSSLAVESAKSTSV